MLGVSKKSLKFILLVSNYMASFLGQFRVNLISDLCYIPYIRWYCGPSTRLVIYGNNSRLGKREISDLLFFFYRNLLLWILVSKVVLPVSWTCLRETTCDHTQLSLKSCFISLYNSVFYFQRSISRYCLADLLLCGLTFSAQV